MDVNKNRAHWNGVAEAYDRSSHTNENIQRIINHPAAAFHSTTWRVLCNAIPSIPDLRGLRVCVPSSGDNHAVYAFALMGAAVTSCDISERQLENAKRVSDAYGWDIEYRWADTMQLDGISNNTYDLVYTSNGVHVWLNDLPSMYRNVYRILKTGGTFLMYEIHPFMRPFNGQNREVLEVKKPYDNVGPFEDDNNITFAWRIQDFLNAMMDAGLTLRHIEEMYEEYNPIEPFWKRWWEDTEYTEEEIAAMRDWRRNPLAAIPNWMCIHAVK